MACEHCTTEITNYDDIIDSRAVIERIEALEADDERTEEESAELATLQALAAEASGAADWTYGETLIRDSYFQTYAQELAEDIGAVNSEASWPNNCIDWAQAARELQMDYTSVSFGGVDYWIR